MLPLDINALGPLTTVLITLGIGFGFGFALEQAGFGDSRKLAAQFYLHEMRVLKVMFTGIITAMLLTFWGVALGWINFELIYVNPTHLGSGILGGLIFGVGFIIGGYCPGTALVAAITLKMDGLVFVLGALFGAFVFAEIVPGFRRFYDAGGDRLTLPDWLNLPAGVVVFLVMLMAMFMFWGAEKLEKAFARPGSPGWVDEGADS